MEITKKDIIQMISIIKSNYSYAYKDIDNDTMRLMIETWFSSLSRYDKRVVDVAFRKAIETCKMPPTLADILGYIKDIKVSTEPSDTELWEMLVRASNQTADCTYYFNFGLIEDNGKTQGENARARFNKIWENLPQLLKDYCGNKNGLIDLSKIDMNFEKGRFFRIIPTIKQRQEIVQTTSPEIMKLVSGLSKSFDSKNLLSFDDDVEI